MITFECDRCERELSEPETSAGAKVECPHCGDINVVPEAKPAPGGEAAHQSETLTKLGLPPDSGPEQRVMMVRPSIFRGSPFRCLALALAPIAGPVLLYLLLGQLGTGNRASVSWWSFAVVAVLSWGWLGVWWAMTVLGKTFEITNKRTIERRGIVRRDTSEVVHDHVRNIQINQSVLDRVFNVGTIGISSSGQDGIEIMMEDLPRPQKLKEVIDAYRPL